MNSTEQFVETLLSAVPEVQAIYSTHIDDNGSLLPHVFMSDVTRFAVHLAQNSSNHDTLSRLLSVVEEGLRSEETEVVELAAVSFVENLCGEEVAVTSLTPMMGDATRRELKTLCGY